MRTIADELIKISENLPLFLQYFVPGIWCIFLLRFAIGKKIKEKYELVLSCVISYLLLSFVDIIRLHKWFSSLPDNVYCRSAIAIVLGTAIVILISALLNFERFKQFTLFLFHKTHNESIWDDVFDYKNGSNLKIILKDKDYYVIGQYSYHEIDKWIAVSGFGLFDVNTNLLKENEPCYIVTEDTPKETKELYENTLMVLRFSDIEHIVII